MESIHSGQTVMEHVPLPASRFGLQSVTPQSHAKVDLKEPTTPTVTTLSVETMGMQSLLTKSRFFAMCVAGSFANCSMRRRILSLKSDSISLSCCCCDALRGADMGTSVFGIRHEKEQTVRKAAGDKHSSVKANQQTETESADCNRGRLRCGKQLGLQQEAWRAPCRAFNFTDPCIGCT
jgi:hypothetical protein